jgi:hypothetical protein
MLERALAPGLLVLALGTSQVAREEPSRDPIPALLTEVRQLRLAMERSATMTPRIQLLTSRMSLQDERVSRMSRQAEGLRDEVDRLAVQGRELAMRAKQLEEALAAETDPQRRSELEEVQRSVKAETELQAERRQLTRAREAEAASALATEQARWTELSERLDELESLLEPR